jgi:hypothetical protein
MVRYTMCVAETTSLNNVIRDISDHKLIKYNYIIEARSLDMQFNVKKDQ